MYRIAWYTDPQSGEKVTQKSIFTQNRVVNRSMIQCIVFALMFISTLSQGICQQTKQDSNKNNCKICYNSLVFNNCTYQNPAQNFFFNTLTRCRQVCCQFSGSELRTRLCQNTSNDKSTQQTQPPNTATILIIVFFTIPGVICLIIIICNCVKSCRRNRHDQTRRFRHRRRGQDPGALSGYDLADYNIDEVGPVFVDPQQTCSICLQSNCNVRTSCRHLYHPKCLSTWIKKRQSCPLCQTNQFNPVIVYCSRCFKSVKLAYVIKNMNIQEVRQWQGLSKQVCDYCLKMEQSGQEKLSFQTNSIRQENPASSDPQKNYRKEEKTLEKRKNDDKKQLQKDNQFTDRKNSINKITSNQIILSSRQQHQQIQYRPKVRTSAIDG